MLPFKHQYMKRALHLFKLRRLAEQGKMPADCCSVWNLKLSNDWRAGLVAETHERVLV